MSRFPPVPQSSELACCAGAGLRLVPCLGKYGQENGVLIQSKHKTACNTDALSYNLLCVSQCQRQVQFEKKGEAAHSVRSKIFHSKKTETDLHSNTHREEEAL